MQEYTRAFSSSQKDHLMGRQGLVKTFDNVFQFDMFTGLILHGQRQIGKSWFLKDYCKNKATIYFTATRNLAECADELRSRILEFLANKDMPEIVQDVYAAVSFYDLIASVFKISTRIPRMFLIIDEFNYLVETENFDIYAFKRVIDKFKDESVLRFILCGSNSGILSTLADVNKPLYGRFAYCIEMSRVSYKATLMYLSSYEDNPEKLMCGMLCSGMPQLIVQAASFNSLSQFINYLFGTSPEVIRSYVEYLMLSERVHRDAANAVVAALAGKDKTLNDLNVELAPVMSTTQFKAVMKQLLDTRLIEPRINLFSKHMKSRVYLHLNSTLFVLYAAYLKQGHRLIEDFRVHSPKVHALFGHAFEDLCNEFLIDHLELECLSKGFWEDIVGPNKQRHEADNVIVCEPKQIALINECKFTEQPVTNKIIEDLLADCDYISTGKLVKQPVCIANTFSSSVDRQNSSALLFDLHDLINWYRNSNF